MGKREPCRTRGSTAMFVVLSAVVMLLVALAAWGARRHVAAQAWDRELDLAFAVGERRDMPTHRVL